MRRSARNKKYRQVGILSWVVLVVALHNPPLIAAPSVGQFLKRPDLIQMELSPDGRYLAQVWNRASDNIRIVTVSDLSQPDQPIVGTLADGIRRPNSVSWANDERLLVNVLVPFDTNHVIRQSQRQEDFDINDYFMFRRTIAVDFDAGNGVTLLDGERGLRGNVIYPGSNITCPTTRSTSSCPHRAMTP